MGRSRSRLVPPPCAIQQLCGSLHPHVPRNTKRSALRAFSALKSVRTKGGRCGEPYPTEPHLCVYNRDGHYSWGAFMNILKHVFARFAFLFLFALANVQTAAWATTETHEVKNEKGCVAFFPMNFRGDNWSGPCLNGLAHGQITVHARPQDWKPFKVWTINGYVERTVRRESYKGYFDDCGYRQSVKHGRCETQYADGNSVKYFDNGTETSSATGGRASTSADSSGKMCEAQKRTCLATCGNPSYWNGKTYVENQSWSRCNWQCESIRCN